MSTKNRVKTTMYAQIEGTRSIYAPRKTPGGERLVDMLKVVAVTKTKTPPRKGCVVVKLNLDLPCSVFEPLEPEVTIVVPESLLEVGDMTVEATDANEEQA